MSANRTGKKEGVPAVTDPDDKILRLLARHDAVNSDLGLVAADDAIMEVLFAAKLAWYLFLPWRSLSFHHSNRDGVLGHQAEVVDLVEDIRYIGWSDKAVSHALCAETEPGNTYS